jgi:hypothetical protein
MAQNRLAAPETNLAGCPPTRMLPQRYAAKAGTPIIALIQHGALKSNSPNDSFWRRMAK